MIYIDIVGFAAGVLTTLSTLPQVLKTLKMKETHELSLVWLSMLTTGTLLWAVYGCLIGSLPIIVANSVSFLLVSVLLLFKLKYK